jgi:hypothetical protein
MVGTLGGACSISQHTNQVQKPPTLLHVSQQTFSGRMQKSIDFHSESFDGSIKECVFYATPKEFYHNFNLAQDRSAKPP